MYANNTADERYTVLIVCGSITVQARLGVLLRTIIRVTTLPEQTSAAMHEFA